MHEGINKTLSQIIAMEVLNKFYENVSIFALSYSKEIIVIIHIVNYSIIL